MALLTSRGEETLKVFIRVRPPILKEVQLETAVMVQGDQQVSIVSDNKEATCTYDHVFNELTEQEGVFEFVKPLLVDVLSGVNSCIFAYGQTSSGKSYTMIGPNGGQDMMKVDRSLWGLLPRASEFLMGYLNEKQSEGILTFEAKASFLQIYNENLYDLLRDSGPAIEDRLLETRNGSADRDSDTLKIREVPKPRSKLASSKETPKEVYVAGLSEFRVQTSEDIMRILAIGTNNRMTRSTDFNATSSRSHALLQINFDIESQSESGQTLISRSKLNLIDLAGSEKLPVFSESNTAKHIKELSAINKSLSSLGNVIAALASTTRTHIPYRDSKLTRILQDSLSGNTRTILIACIAPTVLHTLESMSTLQFAERAKNVKLSVRANTLVDDKVTLAKAQAEIARLKALLSHAMKQLEEKNINTSGATASDFEKLVVENEQLKKQNLSLKKLVQNNKLGSFDDMSVYSSRSNRSNQRSARKGGGGAGFLSGVDRFGRAGGGDFFPPGNISRLAQPKKYKTPKKPKNDWDADYDSREQGSNMKRRYSRDSGYNSDQPQYEPSPARRQQYSNNYNNNNNNQNKKSSYSSPDIKQSKYLSKVYQAINERQAMELQAMYEEAQQKLAQQQQHNAMMDPQQQILLYQQSLQGAGAAGGAGGGGALPPGSFPPFAQQAIFNNAQPQQQFQQHPGLGKYAQNNNPVHAQQNAYNNSNNNNQNNNPAYRNNNTTTNAPAHNHNNNQNNNSARNNNNNSNNNAMQFSPPQDGRGEWGEFYPLSGDEGKHIPIISISSEEPPMPSSSSLRPLPLHVAEAPTPSYPQGGPGVGPPSSSARSQPIVKPLPAVKIETETPANRIFLKKAGAGGAGAAESMKTLQGVHPPAGFAPSPSFPPSHSTPALPKLTPKAGAGPGGPGGGGMGVGQGPGGGPGAGAGAGGSLSQSTSLFASAVSMYSSASKASHMLGDLVRNNNQGSADPPPGSSSTGAPPLSLRGQEEVGRELDMFSFRNNTWERIEVVDYEASKRLYKVVYPNGSAQWIDLAKKPIRATQ